MERVYHYTTMSAFLSLLESIQKSSNRKSFVFRATNIFFLNDPQEFLYGQKVLMDVLSEIEVERNVDSDKCLSSLFKGRHDKNVEELLINLPNNIGNQNESPYVISFSRNSDSLPMWLNYGDRGRGICLAFAEYRSNFISDSFSPKDLADVKVEIYDRLGTHDVYYDARSISYTDNSLREQIVILYDYYLNEIKEASLGEIQELKIRYLRVFVEVAAPYIKTKYFEGEREVRLAEMVNETRDKRKKQVNFRCNAKGNIVPYIDIEIPTKQLDYIRLGPLVNKNITINVIEMMKKRFELEFGIKESEVIYRDY